MPRWRVAGPSPAAEAAGSHPAFPFTPRTGNSRLRGFYVHPTQQVLHRRMGFVAAAQEF